MLSEDDLRGVERPVSKDAKWNLFRFQDHLLEWIFRGAECFFNRDYPSCFEALSNVYIDANGFFDEVEKGELDKLFDKAKLNNDKYIAYNIEYTEIQEKVRGYLYQPPLDTYTSLILFRAKLMEYLAAHNLLIPMIKKDGRGAMYQ